jgi:hypothetical protein
MPKGAKSAVPPKVEAAERMANTMSAVPNNPYDPPAVRLIRNKSRI